MRNELYALHLLIYKFGQTRAIFLQGNHSLKKFCLPLTELYVQQYPVFLAPNFLHQITYIYTFIDAKNNFHKVHFYLVAIKRRKNQFDYTKVKFFFSVQLFQRIFILCELRLAICFIVLFTDRDKIKFSSKNFLHSLLNFLIATIWDESFPGISAIRAI
jgi:hypothetical protein